MREMKDSGVEWIGEIPVSWQILTIGSVFKVRNEKVNDTDYPPLSVAKGGVVPQMENVAKSDANDNRKMVLSNDFVINSRSDRKQSCGVSPMDGSVSLINTVLYPANGAPVIPAYLNYLLKNYGFAEEFYRWGHGIVADLWTTRWQEMKSILLPIPSMGEQQQILEAISEKTDKVDTLIANVEAQIEKLKAYKQSLITEVVTKGLDPSVPMKNSGVDVYPSVPEHWNVQKALTTLTMPITDGPHTTPELLPEGIPFVSAEAVSCGNGGIDFDHIRGFISREFYDECSKKYVPQRDDIYMIKSGATTGRVSVVDTDRIFTIWSPLAVFRCNPDVVHFRFLYYFLQSSAYQRQVQFGWTYGTQQNIGMRTLERLKVFVPPLDEQYAITECLDAKCIQIDRLIAIKQAKIEKLEQYKRSLIYEYVTGKKEVC